MADYYPLIARAIAELDPGASGEVRRALYERARTALISQLRAQDPPLLEAEITRERLALEDAVRRVEVDAAKRPRRRSGNEYDEVLYGRRSNAPLTLRSSVSSAESIPQAEADGLDELARLIGQTDPFSNFGKEDTYQFGASLLKSDLPITPTNDAPSPNTSPKSNLDEAWTRVRNVIGLSEPRAKLPAADLIPPQNTRRAIGFALSRRGPLDVAPDASSDPFDPEQAEMYRRIRDQLRKLKENVPSQERTQIDPLIDDFLAQPEHWKDVEFKKVLWLSGNELRASLATHDTVYDAHEPNHSQLSPGAAEALRRPVQSWNVFVLGDSTLNELDSARLGPREMAEALKSIAAAKPVVDTASANRDITTEQAASALEAAAHAAARPGQSIHNQQAVELADETNKNLLGQIIRRAHQFGEAIVDPRTEEQKAIAHEFEKGAAKQLGATTVVAVITGIGVVFSQTPAFFQFVVTYAPLIREFVAVMQNNQLKEIVDAIEAIGKSLPRR